MKHQAPYKSLSLHYFSCLVFCQLKFPVLVTFKVWIAEEVFYASLCARFMLTEWDIWGLEGIYAVKLADHIFSVFSVPPCASFPSPCHRSGGWAVTHWSPLKGTPVKRGTVSKTNFCTANHSNGEKKKTFSKNSMKPIGMNTYNRRTWLKGCQTKSTL